MKKIAKLLLIGSLILFFSCQKNVSTKELESHFTKKEISDLRFIIDSFKGQICDNNKNSDFKECFVRMNTKLIHFGRDSIIDNIDFEQQKKMYESISKSTYDKIWGFSISRKYTDTTKYKSLSVSTVGKYVAYMKDVGENHPFIKIYLDNFLSTGDIDGMGYLGYHIYKEPNDLDLNDLNIQTIISINYFTILDNVLRVEKWYE